ncbi:hypothetical protein PR048_011833 [Dryococelus australis]|uniref:Uncharacterized protein n=1 Tax=Dryococelus australis TaxID=614101 RepID=A0ABQ9HMX3_9NEOP|nr:hypothetical protein PR048_011833 [Dryococelus australis]
MKLLSEEKLSIAGTNTLEYNDRAKRYAIKKCKEVLGTLINNIDPALNHNENCNVHSENETVVTNTQLHCCETQCKLCCEVARRYLVLESTACESACESGYLNDSFYEPDNMSETVCNFSDTDSGNAEGNEESEVGETESLVFDFELVQKGIVKGELERAACENIMKKFVSKENCDVKLLLSDRHKGIRYALETRFPNIENEFDVWHFSKSLAKKIKALDKKHPEIQAWKASIIDKFISILHHTKNEHKWLENGEYKSCERTEPSEDERKTKLWLDGHASARQAIKKITRGSDKAVYAATVIRDSSYRESYSRITTAAACKLHDRTYRGGYFHTLSQCKRGPKVETATRIKCVIAAKRKALNWRTKRQSYKRYTGTCYKSAIATTRRALDCVQCNRSCVCTLGTFSGDSYHFIDEKSVVSSIQAPIVSCPDIGCSRRVGGKAVQRWDMEAGCEQPARSAYIIFSPCYYVTSIITYLCGKKRLSINVCPSLLAEVERVQVSPWHDAQSNYSAVSGHCQEKVKKLLQVFWDSQREKFSRGVTFWNSALVTAVKKALIGKSHGRCRTKPEASTATVATIPWAMLQRAADKQTILKLVASLQHHDGNTAHFARRSDEALEVRVSVARIAPSLLDLERKGPSLSYVTAYCRARQRQSADYGFTDGFAGLMLAQKTYGSTQLALLRLTAGIKTLGMPFMA